MENPPKTERLRAVPDLDESDVVLAALREQLKGHVIDFDLYQERREAYLKALLPEPPDIVA